MREHSTAPVTPEVNNDTETAGTFLPPITGGGLFETMSGTEGGTPPETTGKGTGEVNAPQMLVKGDCIEVEYEPKIRDKIDPVIDQLIKNCEPTGSLEDDLKGKDESPWNPRELNHFEKWRLNILAALKAIENLEISNRSGDLKQYYDMSTPRYDKDKDQLVRDEWMRHMNATKVIDKMPKGKDKKTAKKDEDALHAAKLDAIENSKGETKGVVPKEDAENHEGKNKNQQRFVDTGSFEYMTDGSNVHNCKFQFHAPKSIDYILPVFTPQAMDSIIDAQDPMANATNAAGIYSQLQDATVANTAGADMSAKFNTAAANFVQTNGSQLSGAKTEWREQQKTNQDNKLKEQYGRMLNLHPTEESWNSWFPALYPEAPEISNNAPADYYDQSGAKIDAGKVSTTEKLYDASGKRTYLPGEALYDKDGFPLPKTISSFITWVNDHPVSTTGTITQSQRYQDVVNGRARGWELDDLKVQILSQQSKDMLYDQQFSKSPPAGNTMSKNNTQNQQAYQMEQDYTNAGKLKDNAEGKPLVNGDTMTLNHVTRCGVYGTVKEKRWSGYDEQSAYVSKRIFPEDIEETMVWQIQYTVSEV
jgi:hypothetical protein